MAPHGSVRRRWDLQQIHSINTTCRGLVLAGDVQHPGLGGRSTEEVHHPSKVLLQPGLSQDPSARLSLRLAGTLCP